MLGTQGWDRSTAKVSSRVNILLEKAFCRQFSPFDTKGNQHSGLYGKRIGMEMVGAAWTQKTGLELYVHDLTWG